MYKDKKLELSSDTNYFSCCLTLSSLPIEGDTFVNSVHPDETGRIEPSHLYLCIYFTLFSGHRREVTNTAQPTGPTKKPIRRYQKYLPLLSESGDDDGLISHDKLKSKLKEIINQCFFHKTGNRRFQYVVIGYKDTYFVRDH